MSQVGTLVTIGDDTTLSSDDVNQNFSDLKTAINTAVFTDQANKITAHQLVGNAIWIRWRNAADTATVDGLRLNSSNLLELGTDLASLKMPTASSIALGGGAGATLGTVGGSGPAAAGQGAWLQITINGQNRWLPYWA